MESLQSDNPNSQPAPTGTNQEANTYEDEINLIDYFRVLWKHKYLISLGSVLPALIVGLILFSRPRKYKVTYVYDVKDRSTHDVSNRNLNEKNYNKKIENKIFASAPVTEKPKVYAVSKGTVKKSAIVFAISVMLSVFVAFLLEGLQKSQVQTS